MLQNRMLKDGKLNAYWVMSTTTSRPAPNLNEERLPGYRNPENFIVVSDVYPTVTAACGRPDPARGDVGGEGRRLRQCRAPHAVLASTGGGAGRARSDLWQLMEFSKHFKVEEVWPAELIAKKPEYRGKTLYDVLYKNGGRQISGYGHYGRI